MKFTYNVQIFVSVQSSFLLTKQKEPILHEINININVWS